jgi:DNA-binding response OmpR family regulator
VIIADALSMNPLIVEDEARMLELLRRGLGEEGHSVTCALARLRAVRRRADQLRDPKLRVSDLTLDPSTREVSRAGLNISLTRTEYNLLERLMYRAGRFSILASYPDGRG